MDHYRQRKYRGPETWARVREAYVAGENGPSVARRFDVGLANLRKKAMKEGWTRTRVAQVLDRDLPPRREPRPTLYEPAQMPGTLPSTGPSTGRSTGPSTGSSLTDGLPSAETIRSFIGGRNVTVMEAFTFATARAASLLAEGRAAEANVQISAIANLAKLTGMTLDAQHHGVLRSLMLELHDVEPGPPKPTKSEAHFNAIMAEFDRIHPPREETQED